MVVLVLCFGAGSVTAAEAVMTSQIIACFGASDIFCNATNVTFPE